MRKAIVSFARTRLCCALAVVILLARLASAQAAPSSISFTFTSFDYPGAVNTFPSAINKAGIVVGSYRDASLNLHGFVRQANGTFQRIDYPGAIWTVLTGINDLNQVVGQYLGSDGVLHGFLFTPPNQLTPIAYPAGTGTWTYPYGINNSGQIVGSWFNGTSGGFSLLNGNYTDLTHPNASGITASAVNSAGVIVGSWYPCENCTQDGFLLTSVSGSYFVIVYPGAVITNIDGINDLDEVVGTYNDGVTFHGWVGKPSKIQYFTVDYPGSIDTVIVGITNARHLVGIYGDSAGFSHGFIAVPK